MTVAAAAIAAVSTGAAIGGRAEAVGAGVAIVVLLVLMARSWRRAEGRRRLAVPAALAAALAVVSVIVAARAFDGGSGPAPVQGVQLTAQARGDAGPDAPNPALLDRQLAAARRVASRYPTLAAALADGFTQAAPYAPGIGSHYMKYSRIYLPFNASAPSMLLFDGDAPTSKIVGLAYYVYDSQGPPAGFAGPLDQWHQHQTTCLDKTGAHFEGDDDSIGCRGRGRNAWMLHLWVTPGQQSPQLIFSTFCNILT